MLMTRPVTILRHLVGTLIFFCITACTSTPLSWSSLKTHIRAQFPTVTHITTADFRDNYLGQSLLVDVRDQAEFSVSHINGAVHFQDAAQLAAWIKQQPNQPVVLYCSVGYRSAQMAKALQKKGIEQVVNLEGSIFEWANQGQPVVNATGPTDKVHAFNQKWGQLLEEKYHP